MKVVILAGGFGTRLAEETVKLPKPMVEIGGQPILWHIMKIYSHYGFNDFIVLLGYKGSLIKDYFLNYYYNRNDLVIDLKDGSTQILNQGNEPWKITLLDTGLDTMTGGRIKRAEPYIGKESFLLTYGDGVGNVDIVQLVNFHKKHGKAMTITAVQPKERFGILEIEDDKVIGFQEKPFLKDKWINAGFFVCEPKVLSYLTQGDQTVFEQEPLKMMAQEGEVVAYKHRGFWYAMDTMKDKLYLENLWMNNKAPWKIWT